MCARPGQTESVVEEKPDTTEGTSILMIIRRNFGGGSWKKLFSHTSIQQSSIKRILFEFFYFLSLAGGCVL